MERRIIENESQAIIDVIIKARSLIENPRNWTKGQYARNVYGNHADLYSQDAVCFCLVGALKVAIGKVGNRESTEEMMEHTRFQAKVLFVFKMKAEMMTVCCLSEFNDGNKHEKVLSLFDHVIKRIQDENIGA